MFIGLQDLSPDLFYEINDENIKISISELESIPALAQYIPMGSFGEDGASEFLNLSMNYRIEVGKLFLLRDGYAIKKFGETFILRDIFLQEFNTIPKLVDVLKIAGGDTKSEIPVSDFTTPNIYYLITLYFSSTYRSSHVNNDQLFRSFDLLTDVNLELNKYTMITKLSTFFFGAFQHFLGTRPGEIPFQNSYGTIIKDVIHTKNTVVQRVNVENEINYFIEEFNSIYGDLIKVQEIKIDNKPADDGGDTWIVSVFAYIENEFLEFQIVSTR